MNKLKAFTLVELLVGMIISALIITMCYYGYAIIQKQYTTYRSTKLQLIKAMQLNTALNRDFIDAAIAWNADKQLYFVKDTARIQYEFNDSYIVRSDRGVRDTFNLIVNGFTPHYLQLTSGNVVDEFYFDVLLFDETQRFHFTKIYSAETRMNTLVPIIEN